MSDELLECDTTVPLTTSSVTIATNDSTHCCIDLTQSEEVSSTTLETVAHNSSDEVIFIENDSPSLTSHCIEPPNSSSNDDDIIFISSDMKAVEPPKTFRRNNNHSSLSGLACLAGIIDTTTKFKPLKNKTKKKKSKGLTDVSVIDISELSPPHTDNNVDIESKYQNGRNGVVNISVNEVQKAIKEAEKYVNTSNKGEEEGAEKNTSDEIAVQIVNKIDAEVSMIIDSDEKRAEVVADDEVVVVVDEDDECKVVEEINSSDKDTCAICLAASFTNRSFLNSCFHAFCYFCIMQWSEIAQTCPLCKSSFRYIVHDVKSITDYKETHVTKNMTVSLPPERRYAFRTTIRYRTTGGVGRAIPSTSSTLEIRRKRRRRPQPENGVDIIKESRERVYTNQLYAKTPRHCRKRKQRICTPEFFKQYPATKHRLAQWLNNELEVLLYENKDHVTFVLQIIWSSLDKYPIQSEEFKKEVRAFLFDNTDLFCHELRMFAQSPFDFKTYIEKVQYDFPTIDLDEAPSTSTWDSSPVRYIGGEGSANSTLARTRWDDDSPVLGMAMSQEVVTMVTEDNSDVVVVTEDKLSDSDSIEFLYERDGNDANKPKDLTPPQCPSTPVYVTSPPTTPINLTSPGANSSPCPATPVYVTVESKETDPISALPSIPKNSGKSPKSSKINGKSKGKGKQKRKKIILDDDPDHSKRSQLRSVVRIPSTVTSLEVDQAEEQPCSSRHIT